MTQEKRPSLAIVIPAYNVSSYIKEALDSVIEQAPAFDEIIIINDGSTDDTLSKINSHPCKTKAQIITTSNQGLGQARNIGINSTNSDYIYFFDSDDVLDKSFSKVIHASLKEGNSPDIVFFAGDQFLDGNVDNDQVLPPFSRNCTATAINNEEALIKLQRSKSLLPSACLYVSNRNLWANYGLHFKPILHEDEEILFKLFLHADSISILDIPIFHRRVRPGSIMSASKTPAHCEGLRVTALALIDDLKNLEITQKATKNILRKKAIRHAKRYMRTCHKTGITVDFRSMFACAKNLHSLDILLGMAGAAIKKRFT